MPESDYQLKYGTNPNQVSALLIFNQDSPKLEVINGTPSYINILDALNAWQLVRELKFNLNLPAAASFKHVSPAGAAIAVPLSDVLKKAYFVEDMELSPLATAYARARGADRVSSFGDFIALSDACDVCTAALISREVSDGVIAPSYDKKAIELLQKKRGGNYLMIKIDPDYEAPDLESRQVFGVILEQKHNNVRIDMKSLLNVVTEKRDIPEGSQRDLVLSLITLKYTQSNSICFACDGQAIGIGAGQQSRVHCTRLAGNKADLWWLRQHPKVLELQFAPGLNRAEKNNTIDAFLSDDLTLPEEAIMRSNLNECRRMSKDEQAQWISKLTGVSLGSDAMIPFRDSIDRASRSGVKYIAQAGGSNRDDSVIAAANDYGIVMVMNGIRLFHH